MKATLAPSSLISLPRHKVSSLRSPSLLLQSQRPSSALMTTTTASRGSVAVTAAATSSVEALREGIAEFYNETSGLWEEIWGDHMHHGFYDPDSSVQLSDSGHREAQIRMIEESLRFAGVTGSLLMLYT